MLTRIESISRTDASDSAPGGLHKLNLLLEATSLLHSQLPLDSVLGTMLDHAIAITDADRGLLLEADSAEQLHVRLARGSGGTRLSPESLAPSQTALRQALEQRSSIITKDLNLADLELQAAQSIVAQHLRAVAAIPLYAMPRASSMESVVLRRGNLLGVLYLDSRRPAAFTKLDHQILAALAVEAASILDNARLVERERQRQRLEQELSIARDIQQALLPGGFRDFPHLAVAGSNTPCLAVGGDYYDVFPMDDNRTAFLIADVSGKGLGAALLTTMLQGALTGMTIGADPARVFNLINRFLCEHAEVGRYATMFFGILDLDGHLNYINAGHPSPLLLRHGVVTEPFIEGSYPVGLIPEADYVTARMELQHDDTLVLFSDGVTEAMDPDEQMYGVPRLRGVLDGQQDASLDHLQKAVFESVRNFTRGTNQGDDITLLLVRYRAAVQTATS
jgi:sigma-B regulation protein RsbU (phosphoserine phosphatase)